ncbi:MAG TPA: IPTL-CTERM sorting domain-containing protein [Thermoanaerobaculia bacterium]|nr:IPTL-CTERM sorting domain-containing protein [Thermoanaerobaculia bacterium]
MAPRVFAQCVSLTTLGAASTQSFDTLSNTAGSTTNNLTITGWFMTESGGGARDNEQYAVDTGGSNTGDTFSYGAAGNTERALGGLQSGTLIPTIGVCYTNNTGATITSLDVAYHGEQWRISNTAAARDDRMDFQYSMNATDLVTGTWTDVNALDVVNVVKTNGTATALDGNTNRSNIAGTIASLSIANGATFWIRWNDLNASGADDGLAVDDFSLTPQAGPVMPTLNVNDVTLAEGDAGTTTFTFTVSLTAPAGPGGVTFDIATADGTATTADSDYVAQSLTGQTIPAGSSTYAFNVQVNGDTTTESNQTFFVNVTSITGANSGDVQGLGTINNDDVTVTPIHDVQGPGATSPIVGSSVTIRGIVTGVKSNGFFMQEEDAEVDADPATSEGIFVFTSGPPPGAVVFTAQVQVTGTVAEFVPSSDLQQPPLTEITAPSVSQLAPAGQPLPAAVPLSATFPDPAGPHDQLERVEGMRVSAASITVSGPSDGSINEPNNTGTSNGRFHGVITGVARPFREPGIQQPDVPPSGTIPPIPRWDANPERLRIESATINAQPVLTVKSGDVVAPVTGVLDYGFRGYAIYPDGTLGTPIVTPGTLPTTVTTPTAQEFTVSSFNMFHFYDTANDGATSDVVLTAGAYADRLAKASIAIRNHLKFPDVLGVQEAENLTVLQDLATKINADAVTNSQPNPQYVAYLSEGNDVGGIDVGFLVKSAEVSAGVPRVEVNSVTQIGAATTWIDPDDNTPALLNDRPSLVLDAIVHRNASTSYPLVVVNNHLRSLIGIDSSAPDGLTTEGDRVRRKRQAQAEFLANYLQGRLTSDPNENIVLVGDFNAFEFNDGYVDPINVLSGTPPPDNETVVTGDGVDLVNPNFTNLFDTPPPAERYSYLHDGNAQNIDHAIVSAGLIASTSARRIEHPRINTDYPETERANNASALRISDHDPVVAFFTAAAFFAADVSITKTENVDPVNAGQNFFYTIVVTNSGPDSADAVSWTDTLPAGTSFVSLSSPGGWSCTTPAVGANGTITCSIASLAVTTANFTLTVSVDPTLAAGTVLSNTATVTSSTADPSTGNESATATTTVATSADLMISKSDTPDPVIAGNNISYQLTLTNNGPSNAANAAFSDTLPAGTTFVSLSSPGGWSCTTPAVGANGTITCSIASLVVTNASFTLTVNVDPALASGTVLSNTATATSSTADPSTGNESATATTTVTTSADLMISKTDTPDPVTAGNNISYQLTLTNNGPSNAANATFSDTLPAGTTFVSLSTTGAWSCTTPAVGATGTVSCTNASWGATVDFFTLVVNVDPALANGTVLSNTATLASATSDSNSGNNSDTATTTVTSSPDVGVTMTDNPDPVTQGSSLTYTINVSNGGPSTPANVSLSDTLPAGTTFQSLSDTGGGWSCTTPAFGASGTINCTVASLTSNTIFTLVVTVGPATPDGTILSNTATVSASSDSNAANNSAVVTTTVSASPDLSVVVLDAPDPVNAGGNITYTIEFTNSGPTNANAATLTDVLPASTTFVSLSSPAGWSCTTPAVGANGTVTCTNPSFAQGLATFTLVIGVPAGTPSGTTISNTATVATSTPELHWPNNSATATTTVEGAMLTATKSVSGSFTPGGAIMYTIVITNNGGSTQQDNAGNEFTDVLPSSVDLVNATATSGTALATIATNTVTWNGSLTPGASVTITINATIDSGAAAGTTVSNQGTLSYDANGDGTNDASGVTDSASQGGATDPTTFVIGGAPGFAAVPTLDEWALIAFAALLGMVALVAMKRA